MYLGILSRQVIVCVVILLSLCTALLIVRPFAKGHEWKLRVRAMLLILAASCSVMNALVVAIGLGAGTAQMELFVTVGELLQ